MATVTPSTNEPEWTDVNRGLGTQITLEENESFVGFYLSSHDIETDDKFNKGKTRTSAAHQFVPEDNPDGLVFLWGNGILDTAMLTIGQGELTRVTYLGEETYTDKKTLQPRRVKKYRVQVAGRKTE
jgi:hypothetical protein